MAAAPSPRIMFNNFAGQFKVQFIKITSISNASLLPEKQGITQQQQQAILAFGISSLLNILQLKYQGKPNSPFDTHPITIGFATFSFLIYCFLMYWFECNPELQIPTTRPTCAKVIHQAARSLGYFSLSAFATILFPAASIHTVVYLVFALFLAGLMHWVMSKILPRTGGGGGYGNQSRRIEVPLTRAFVDDRDMLPV